MHKCELHVFAPTFTKIVVTKALNNCVCEAFTPFPLRYINHDFKMVVNFSRNRILLEMPNLGIFIPKFGVPVSTYFIVNICFIVIFIFRKDILLKVSFRYTL